MEQSSTSQRSWLGNTCGRLARLHDQFEEAADALRTAERRLTELLTELGLEEAQAALPTNGTAGNGGSRRWNAEYRDFVREATRRIALTADQDERERLVAEAIEELEELVEALPIPTEKRPPDEYTATESEEIRSLFRLTGATNRALFRPLLAKVYAMNELQVQCIGAWTSGRLAQIRKEVRRRKRQARADQAS